MNLSNSIRALRNCASVASLRCSRRVESAQAERCASRFHFRLVSDDSLVAANDCSNDDENKHSFGIRKKRSTISTSTSIKDESKPSSSVSATATFVGRHEDALFFRSTRHRKSHLRKPSDTRSSGRLSRDLTVKRIRCSRNRGSFHRWTRKNTWNCGHSSTTHHR